MFFTLSAVLYLALGIVFTAVFSSLMDPYAAGALYNIIFLVVIIVDFSTAPSSKKITVTRILDEKLSLGTRNRIELIVLNNWRYKARLELKDWYPGDFKTDKKICNLTLSGYSRGQTCYNVIPTRRGKYLFGPVYVRSYGVLGLTGRQFKIDADREVKVYPNIKDISSYLILARKGRLLEVGLKPSRIYGMGTDFEYLREYQPDDEYRKINWKATARRSKLITSQFQTERSQNIFILIEAGRMMQSRIDGITKFDYALNAALLLAYIAMDKGDNVGLMVFSDEIKAYLPPGKGRKQLKLIVEALYNQEPSIVEPDYGKAVRYLAVKNKKRSLVVFFTDLIDVDVSKAIVLYTRALYPKHLPLCVAVSDSWLYDEAEKIPEQEQDVFHKAVAEDLIWQREQVKTALQRGGVLTLDVSPQNLTPSLISRYLSIKARNQL